MFNEIDYILKVSTRLEKFKRIGNNFNFRCPICGDGHTSYKTRAWFLEKNSYYFHCFNCGYQTSLANFLKENFEEIYQEYMFDKLTSSSYKPSEYTFQAPHTDSKASKICKELMKPLKEFPEALKYLENRLIDSKYFDKIFVIENFEQLKRIDKYKNAKALRNELRIVLPCYNSNGEILGIIGRSIDSNNPKRYINLRFSEEDVMLYGLYNDKGDYNINLNKSVYVCEGAFDSLMLDNCVAVNSSSLLKFEKALSKVLLENLDIIYISDNENRNFEILKVYEKIIKLDRKIVIFPSYVNGKDLNKMKENGHDVQELIKENTYQGLEALVRFGEFKKL